MTDSSGRPPRRGFLASLSDALAPKPIPEDDSGPLITPKGVLAAMVLSILGGMVYLFWGGYIMLRIDEMMSFGRADYAAQVRTCDSYGGIGTAITAESPTGTAAACQAMPVLTDADWDSLQTANLILAGVFLVLGLLLVAGGYFLKTGAGWARRTVVAVAIITVGAAFLLNMSSPIILGATLLILIAVVLCYLSSGATFFLRAKARRHA